MAFLNIKYFYLSFYLIICFTILFYSVFSLTVGKYPYIKKLNNGRYIVMSSIGITFLDRYLINESNTIAFEEEIYEDPNYYFSTSIEQFSLDDDELIIVFFRKYIFDYNIYIFSSNESLLTTVEHITNIDIFDDIQYFSIIPYSNSDNEYYFYIIYCKNNQLIFLKGIIDIPNYNIIFNNENQVDINIDENYAQSFSCNSMIYNNEKIINCIYYGLSNSFNTILLNYKDFSTINEHQIYSSPSEMGIFKSLVLPEKEQLILCTFDTNNFNCFKYNIKTNNINQAHFPLCAENLNSRNSILVEYFIETDEILIGYIDNNKTSIYISQCTKDLICKEQKEYILSEDFYNFANPNIIIPLNKNDYYAFHCNLNEYPKEILFKLNITNNYSFSFNSNSLEPLILCDNYYNYENGECFTDIPDGYYCNNTELKIIEKCHDNCQTCNKGPTKDNNNCLKCKEGLIFDLGNCKSVCMLGLYFINSTLICQCSKDEKCGICTEESLQNNLCITCNKQDNYYPKIDEEIRNDSFINCYKNPEGYYLKNDTFYPCYSTCKSCTEEGNENDNKCTECIIGYEFKIDSEYDSNCYKICDYNYFYDSNNIYNCTPDNNCPENYKLINSKRKCVDNCMKDNTYKLEYNNQCFEECPPGTLISDNYKCEEVLNCKDKYYNYEKTECIDSIPAGFYCNNSELKTIDKCHENCFTCAEGPTDLNNNCLNCINSLYLDLGNCIPNCPNGIFTNYGLTICKCSFDIKCKICSKESNLINQCIICNEDEGYYPKFNDSRNIWPFLNCYNNITISEGYYLNKTLNSYEPCYNTCSKCLSYGDEINNNCDECKIGFYFNSDNDKNCYKCTNYYYYDTYNNYHCTESNYCPENYNKLIRAKRRCIDNCNKDNTYIYEYQNECYSNCPSNMEPNENNVCISKQNELELELELVCPEEYPYEMIQEKKCVQQCNITQLLNNICTINNPKAKESGVNNIKDSIMDGSIDDILKNIKENGEDLIINEKDIKYQITTTDNQNNNQNNNISTIKLGECESILKQKYNISLNDSLLIFKIDVKVEGLSSSVVEYEVFHPITKNPLNLSYCQNISIQIQVPVTINEDELFKYDPSSEYYNDICYPSTSENGTDIILSDRQSEFVNNNLSLCQDGCTFTGYNSNTKKAICECNVKTKISDLTNIKIDKDKFFEGFLDLKSLININVMKCFKLLFSKDGFLNNIGNYILLPIICYNIFSSVLFYLKGYNLLKNQIQKMTELLKEYENYNGNLTNKDVKIFDCNPKISRKKYKKSKKKKDKKKNKKKKKTKIKDNDDNLHNENINNPPKKIYNKNKTNTNINININNNAESINSLKIDTRTILNKNLTTKLEKKLLNDDFKLKYENKPEEKKEKIIKDINYYNDTELNSLGYKEALEIDKRNYFQYYWSLIKKKQLLIFSFYPTNDYNSMIIKICLFLFSFVLYYTVNALFFNDTTMHKIYEDQGSFNFLYNIPQILYSTIISSVINMIVKNLSLSEKNVLQIKNEKNIENSQKIVPKVLNCLIIKFTLFFIIILLFLLLFWYYLACFCAVYKNTQYYLIKDTAISFCISLLYPFGLNLLPGIFRIPSLRNNNKECMYKVSKIIQII